MPPFVRPIRRPLALFDAHAGRCPVDLQIGGVHRDGLFFAVLGGETGHHPCEDAHVAPALLANIACLVRPVFRRRITPAQPIAIGEDNFTQHTPIID